MEFGRLVLLGGLSIDLNVDIDIGPHHLWKGVQVEGSLLDLLGLLLKR